MDRTVSVMQAQMDRLTSNPEFQRLDCLTLLSAATKSAGSDTSDNRFEVVGVVRGCKYFVAEQRSNLSLVEDWLCFRPSRGDAGVGDISRPGIQEVTLSGAKCSVYVDDWLLSRSRAEEKLAEKCSR